MATKKEIKKLNKIIDDYCDNLKERMNLEIEIIEKQKSARK